jgi:hypothetical protein
MSASSDSFSPVNFCALAERPFGEYDEQHRYQLYSEAKWWRHPVVIPRDLHGATQVNNQAVRLPAFHDEGSELIEQYVKAFEKVGRIAPSWLKGSRAEG